MLLSLQRLYDASTAGPPGCSVHALLIVEPFEKLVCDAAVPSAGRRVAEDEFSAKKARLSLHERVSALETATKTSVTTVETEAQQGKNILESSHPVDNKLPEKHLAPLPDAEQWHSLVQRLQAPVDAMNSSLPDTTERPVQEFLRLTVQPLVAELSPGRIAVDTSTSGVIGTSRTSRPKLDLALFESRIPTGAVQSSSIEAKPNLRESKHEQGLAFQALQCAQQLKCQQPGRLLVVMLGLAREAIQLWVISFAENGVWNLLQLLPNPHDCS